ncbi:MAG: threonine aldolase family protein [Alphaproteobacteria bacterium]|nr:threonine aldolase family protein [Alphaproteobacteria bacterium]MBT5390321.1 threonine aldolase family protein [Alphaproteobacteria bacterium]
MKQKFRIDLFSDTNCSISKGMREYMCNAEVGNEVAGEDPTVNLLLERVCDFLGKEAAVFLPSGSMCNTLAFRTWCRRPGDGIIIEKTAHPVLKNPTIFAGLVHAQPILINGNRGIYSSEQLEAELDKFFGFNYSHPCLVSVENPTNYGGGAIWPLEELQAVCQMSRKYSIPTYMDGARLLVAQEKTKISAKKYAEPFDSVFIDFCKVVGAPMGAVLAGSKNFIEDVWFHKFQFGGYMHKAGMLAAACLYGLDNNVKLISSVLDNAYNLGRKLSELPFVKVDLDNIETNIILVKIIHDSLTAYDFEEELAKLGIRIHAYSRGNLRFILHFDIGPQEILEIRDAFEEVDLKKMKKIS